MPDEKSNFALGNFGLFKIVILTGAIIGMASLPQFWFSLDYVFTRFDYAGYDFFLKNLNSPGGYQGFGYYAYMPFAVFAASAAAIAASVLTFTKYEKNGAIAGVSLGMVMLVSTLLYVFYPKSKIAIYNSAVSITSEIKLMDHLGSGVILAVAASILVIAGGVFILMQRRAAAGGLKEK